VNGVIYKALIILVLLFISLYVIGVMLYGRYILQKKTKVKHVWGCPNYSCFVHLLWRITYCRLIVLSLSAANYIYQSYRKGVLQENVLRQCPEVIYSRHPCNVYTDGCIRVKHLLERPVRIVLTFTVSFVLKKVTYKCVRFLRGMIIHLTPPPESTTGFVQVNVAQTSW
jgi:hypothetical protein